MPEKKKTFKIQISKLLIVAFAFVFVVFLALIFTFSRATAPEPKPAPVTNTPPTSTPTENNYVLKIDKLNLSAPIIPNVDGNDKDGYDKALESGIAHLQGSALPGKAGNTFIFGHSSYYAWKPGSYKEIFKNLNDLETGDIITINSNALTYNYKVSDKKTVNPNDVAVADQNFSEKKLTLMTCWPIGSTAQRLVVVALLQETIPIQ